MDRHRTGDTLNIKLKGDLDGSSAWQLLHLLEESCKGINRVIIQTDGLKRICPFGYNTFMNNLYILHQPLRSITNENDKGQIIVEFTK
jgi:hypothetical protein